ncbi:invariant surface glycoprotein-like protein, putative, (fragment), partial [Trypanosoma vivax Y486]
MTASQSAVVCRIHVLYQQAVFSGFTLSSRRALLCVVGGRAHQGAIFFHATTPSYVKRILQFMMHARTFLVLLHGLIILFSHALCEAADEKVDLKLRRYVISNVSAEGLTEKGAATLCRLHALTTNVPSATKRLLEETAYWLETAKNLQHNLTLEERRLKSARNRAGELPTEELKHAESKLENAKKLASAAVTLIREKESTVREAAEIAVANASSARGENTTVRSAGLHGALATH